MVYRKGALFKDSLTPSHICAFEALETVLSLEECHASLDRRVLLLRTHHGLLCHLPPCLHGHGSKPVIHHLRKCIISTTTSYSTWCENQGTRVLIPTQNPPIIHQTIHQTIHQIIHQLNHQINHQQSVNTTINHPTLVWFIAHVLPEHPIFIHYPHLKSEDRQPACAEVLKAQARFPGVNDGNGCSPANVGSLAENKFGLLYHKGDMYHICYTMLCYAMLYYTILYYTLH